MQSGTVVETPLVRGAIQHPLHVYFTDIINGHRLKKYKNNYHRPGIKALKLQLRDFKPSHKRNCDNNQHCLHKVLPILAPLTKYVNSMKLNMCELMID